MASIRQIMGRWQVQIRRAGVRRSRTFSSRAEAEAWAHSIEAPLRFAVRGPAPAVLAEAPTTFGAVVRRYQEQERPKHRSGPNEHPMLNPIQRHWIATVPCEQLSSVHLAAMIAAPLLECPT